MNNINISWYISHELKFKCHSNSVDDNFKLYKKLHFTKEEKKTVKMNAQLKQEQSDEKLFLQMQ